jgi:hypothetical protein
VFIAMMTAPLAIALVLLGFQPAEAVAVSSGPCTFTFNGTVTTTFNTQANALHVAADQDLVVAGGSLGSFKHWYVGLQYAGFFVDAGHGDDSGPRFSTTVNVKTYAQYGAGYYKAQAHADVQTLANDFKCDAEAYILVDKNPMSTAAGIGAALGSGLGLGGVLGGAGGAANEGKGTTEEWEKEEASRKEWAERSKPIEDDDIPSLEMIGCMIPMSVLALLLALAAWAGLATLGGGG